MTQNWGIWGLGDFGFGYLSLGSWIFRVRLGVQGGHGAWQQVGLVYLEGSYGEGYRIWGSTLGSPSSWKLPNVVSKRQEPRRCLAGAHALGSPQE